MSYHMKSITTDLRLNKVYKTQPLFNCQAPEKVVDTFQLKITTPYKFPQPINIRTPQSKSTQLKEY